MRRLTHLLAPVLFLLLPGAGQAAASCNVAVLAGVTGDVKIARLGHSAPAANGDGLCEGDHVATADSAVATLHFSDGTEIIVGKDTEFVVTRWRTHRYLRPNNARFELLKGAFRAVTGAFTQRAHKMEVRTTIATVGVRGTDFWGGIGLTPGGLDVVMLNGHGVYVKNKAGKVELSAAGTGTTVMPGVAPTAPKTWSADKVQRAVQTITP